MTAEEYFINSKYIPSEISEDTFDDRDGNDAGIQTVYNAIIPIPDYIDWDDAVSFLTELKENDCLLELLVIHARHCVEEIELSFNKDQRQAVINFLHCMDKYEWREYYGN